MSRNTILWLLSILMTLAAFGATLALWPGLPERIPTHWNIDGKVDGYGPRATTFLMPAIMLGMVGLFSILPALSPKPFEVNEFRGAYLIIMTLTVALMGYLHGVILYATVHPDMPIGRALVGGMMLFLAAIGNFMGKVRRNLYVGIRTPWTLANDRVWADTHRMGAWMLVAAGLVGGLICLVGLPVWAALIPLAPAVLVPIVYSYTHYKALERRGAL